MSKASAILAIAFMLVPMAVRADDSGPPRTVGLIREQARRLLAREARAAGVDPKNITISDVVVSGDDALISWDFVKQRGLMGLVRNDDRWWDALDATLYGNCWEMQSAYPLVTSSAAYPHEWSAADYEPPPAAAVLEERFGKDVATAAALHNADVRASTELWKKQNPQGSGHLVKPVGCWAATYPVKEDTKVYPLGASIAPPRFQTSGYELKLAYAANDAPASARFKQVYVRAPTPAEFLPNHPIARGFGYSDAVCYFDISVAAAKTVTFKPGTVMEVWFPFVLDDQLQYSLNFMSNGQPSGSIKGSIFDNTVRFVLPEFAIAPDQPLMAEIDGDPKAAQ